MDDLNTLQTLFSKKIRDIRILGELYKGRANHVWCVAFEDDSELIVREPKPLTKESEFSFGVQAIFGVEMKLIFDRMEQLNKKLKQTNSFQIPSVIDRKKKGDRHFIVMEKIEGVQVDTFIDRSPSFLKDYGRKLSKLHQSRFSFFGTVNEEKRDDLEEFHPTLVHVAEQLISRFYSDNQEIKDYLPIFKEKMTKLPAPDTAGYILIDIDPTQYIEKNDVISGLVDTECFAVGPCEFDFIALEYLVTEREAALIRKGYEEISELPSQLDEMRECYRFISLILDIHGTWDINEWMKHPMWFSSNGRGEDTCGQIV